jgi:tRNA(Ile)-lysidine synthase
MSLERIFREAVARHGMARAGDRVVAAVSGGADSVALLHLLVSLGREIGLHVHVAHLDHRWRGAGSAADRAFVQALAAGLGLEATCEAADPGGADLAGLGPEGRAREIRRRFLERVAREVGAGRIATGHTLDDQAETVLLRLLRGSGARGLGGIAPVRGAWIRPLLGASRRQVRDWLVRQGLAWREDPTNDAPAYERNRVRHRLIPLLEQEFRGRLRERLAAAADLLRDDDAFLEQAAAERYGEIAEASADGVSLPVRVLLGEPPALARRLLRRALQEARGGTDPPARRTLERVRDLVAGERGPADLAGGLRAEVRGDRLRIGRAAATDGGRRFEAAAAVPGWVEWPDAGLRLRLQEVDRTAAYRDIKNGPGEVAHLDLERTGERLLLRSRRPGDAFYPLGLGGRKKIQDFLVDAHVPREERSRVALLTAGGEIAWVVGHRIDERFKVTPETRRVLRVLREIG